MGYTCHTSVKFLLICFTILHSVTPNTAIAQISIATTDVTDCKKSDGKATVSVNTTARGLSFEYAVDGRAFQVSGVFTNLSAGNHTATVRDKNTQCSFSKGFPIKDAANKFTLFVSGFGTTTFCNNSNPPTVTLTATASGGSGSFNYNWPGRSLRVSSTGRYTATATDTRTGCSQSLGGDVIFIPVVCSSDPNDIVGPEGYGPGKMIAKSKQHSYVIRFENDPVFATAPAQVVKITHPLDSNVNPFSLRLGDFGFAGMTFTVPPGKTAYSTRLNVVDSLGVVVDVTAGINVVTREAFWIFESKDPATGLPPANASSGFLPVNDSRAKGEGFVTYLVKAADNTQTGDSIHAKARIVFDVNAPIETPVIVNTIDALAPVSKVTAFSVNKDTIRLVWSGQDEAKGSGVRDYDVYVSENGTPFSIYQSGLTDTTTAFTGSSGKTYSFYTLATDNTGNREGPKTAGEQTVAVTGTGLLVSVKAFLQGPYNAAGSSMTDSLRVKALLPAADPYPALGFTPVNDPSAVRINAGVLDSLANKAITDWVWMELRSSANAAQIMATRSALLRRDGTVVDRDGASPVYFNNVPEGSYFVALRHRNHLGVMTATAVALNAATATAIDFSSPATPTYGTAACFNQNGVMLMRAGDVNGNRQVSYNGANNDKNAILGKVGLNTANNILTLYDRTDVNMDGTIKYNGASNDKNFILSVLGLTSPNRIIIEQLPN